MNSKYAPICLFVYNRPLHTYQTINALLKNDLAAESNLIVYSDGVKIENDIKKVKEVRELIRSVQGFKSVSVFERPENMGLANSIIAGVTEVVNKYKRIIVLEEDLVSSPFFLRYMNDALELYQNVEKVISIHGYVLPVFEELPETFLIRGADCWGWATWKRGWDLFEGDGQKLLSELKKRKLTRQFDLGGAYRYTRMLKDQIAGRNSSWAVRWYASAFLKNRLTLYPGRSLIQNIGNDGLGTHVGNLDIYDVELAAKRISVGSIELAENKTAKGIIAEYQRHIKTPFLKAVLRRGMKHLTS